LKKLLGLRVVLAFVEFLGQLGVEQAAPGVLLLDLGSNRLELRVLARRR